VNKVRDDLYIIWNKQNFICINPVQIKVHDKITITLVLIYVFNISDKKTTEYLTWEKIT